MSSGTPHPGLSRAATILAIGGLSALGLTTIAHAGIAAPRPVQGADLAGLRATEPVRDTTLKRPLRARAAGLRSEQFVDPHGHRITMSTDIDGLDLSPYAGVLAGTRHYWEIEDLETFVTEPQNVQALCGPDAVACYGAEDPATSFRGQMVIPREDDDLLHIIVHEYGHHVDNQLANLAHVFPRGACAYDNDGSRNWFFARDVEDNILGRGISCDPDAEWGRLLGELFAEDYTWLVGNRNWVLRRERSPSRNQVNELAYDFAYPLEVITRRMSRFVRTARLFRRLTLDDWRFATFRLAGPRAADLDLFIFRRNGRRPIARSRGRTSRERIRRILPPGRYEIWVDAYRRPGRGALRLMLE